MRRIFQRSSRTSSRLSRPFSLQRVRRYALRPVLELMEERTLLSTFVVNTTSDLDRAGGLPVGQESLRQAIEDVNADTTPDVIDFNLGTGGHRVITLASALPAITNTVTIDGTSQPGYSGSPIVEINGGGLSINELDLYGANSVVKGLVINNNSGGTGIYGTADGIVIQGNFIGTDWTGAVAVPVGDGIVIGANNVLIGGTSPGQGNLISGAIGNTSIGLGVGILIYPGHVGAIIQGNKIGTDVTGSYAIGNQVGISVVGDGVSGGLIGGTAPGAGNLISGNGYPGGFAGGPPAGGIAYLSGATIQGNKIGTDITGTKAIPNFVGIGVGSNNTIGGTVAGAGNLISGNAFLGIGGLYNNVIQGNFIGTDVTGTVALGNGLLACCTAAGIDIGYATIGGTTPAARNIISGNPYGINGGPNNLIEGNYIGTDVTGEVGLLAPGANAGIIYTSGSTIGGTAAGAGNLISSTGSGIRYATNCLIQGNFIGTNKEGTKGIGNGTGIYFDFANQSIGDTIGGAAAGAGNLISGNSIGILFFGSTGNPVVTNLVIQGNLIGTDVTGSAPLGNSDGIILTNGVSDNLIGGTTPGSGNIIAYNGGGVVIASKAAVSWPAADGYGNSMLGNSMYNNRQYPVCCGFGSEIVLIRDPSDPPGQGPNGLQAAPVLAAADAGATTTVTGSLSSSANNTFRIEFFASPGPDAAGNPEGQRYLGFVNVTTDANGNASFTATGLGASSVGEAITATATVLTGSLAGSTSEFSALSKAINVQTTTTLTSSVNPSVYGQAVTFTATVAAAASGAGTPTGSVQFVVDGTNFGAPVNLVNGSATSPSINSLGVGNHTVTAVYSGDPTFLTSTAANLTQTVNQASTTASVSSSLNPSAYTQSVTFTATISVVAPGGGTPTGTVTFQDGGVTLGTGMLDGTGHAAWTSAAASLALGAHSITASYGGDGNFNASPASAALIQTVINHAPVVGAISAPVAPVNLNVATISTSASFSDPDPGDTHTAVWNWGDGSSSPGTVTDTPSSGGSGSVSGSHTYTTDGVFTVTVTVTDKAGAQGLSTFQYVVVYDPSAGFVTGGGWITSPPGAYPANPALTGKATFGFVSKYQKGASVPSGDTQFQFQTAGFNFHSTSYDWLVVAGAKAQYKGSGTVNGAGTDGFLLTAIDGELPGGGGTDKFRIKVWDKATGNIIYDNQMGSSDTADPTTAIGGGDIVIHSGTGSSGGSAGGGGPTALTLGVVDAGGPVLGLTPQVGLASPSPPAASVGAGVTPTLVSQGISSGQPGPGGLDLALADWVSGAGDESLFDALARDRVWARQRSQV